MVIAIRASGRMVEEVTTLLFFRPYDVHPQ